MRKNKELFSIGSIKNDFEILSDNVYKYNNKIYFYNEEIKNIDFDTFKIIEKKVLCAGELVETSIFAYDKNKLYIENFEILNYKLSYLNGDFNTLKNLNFLFADKDYFYICDKQIKLDHDIKTIKHIYSGSKFGSDGKTFHIEILVDKNYLFYYKDNEIKQIKYSFDLETIKYDEKLGLLVDKNGKYDFRDNKISKVK